MKFLRNIGKEEALLNLVPKVLWLLVFNFFEILFCTIFNEFQNQVRFGLTNTDIYV